MKSTLFMIFICLNVIYLNGCNQTNELTEYKVKHTSDFQYEVTKTLFEHDDTKTGTAVRIYHPVISGLSDDILQIKINEILKAGAVNDYSSKWEINGLDLQMEYSIKLITDDIISIRYYGMGYVFGAAHPLDENYSTNINLKTGERLKIKDLFYDSFFDIIDTEVFKFADKDDFEYYGYTEPVKELLTNYALNAAEGGYGEFYFTSDNFGIIVLTPSPNAVCLDFEVSYEDLKDYINWDNPIWSELLEVR